MNSHVHLLIGWLVGRSVIISQKGSDDTLAALVPELLLSILQHINVQVWLAMAGKEWRRSGLKEFGWCYVTGEITGLAVVTEVRKEGEEEEEEVGEEGEEEEGEVHVCV